MYAFEIPGMRFSLPAGAKIDRYRFVSVDGQSNGILATASTPVVGASMNTVEVGHVLEIADGIVIVEAAGAITAGVAVYSDASGKAKSSGTIIVGTAITAATAAGELVSVKI